MWSAFHWLPAEARFCGRTHLPPSPNSTTSTGQGDIPISLTECPCFNIHRIHSTCGHGDISVITFLILSLGGCSCLNIIWYTASVDMMTFRGSRRSYQSICQQHPPYSHPQVTLIYYTRTCRCSSPVLFSANIQYLFRKDRIDPSKLSNRLICIVLSVDFLLQLIDKTFWLIKAWLSDNKQGSRPESQ